MRAHDLDAGQQRGQQAARRAVALDQHAVDAVADADAVGERLDVDVAGPQADRFLDDQVDQLDDRGVAVVGRRRLGGRFGLGEVDGGVGELRRASSRPTRFRVWP